MLTASVLAGIGLLVATPSAASPSHSGSGPPRVSFKEFTLPNIHAWPFSIASGPDGNLWFTENSGHKIGRLTPAGKLTEFRDPGPSGIMSLPGGSPQPFKEMPGYPGHIAAGPDGNLWFTAADPDYIGRITPAGHITDYIWGYGNDAANVNGIAAGPGRDMWFTTSDDLGRITLQGTITLFLAPHHLIPQGIAAGRDGNLWFAAANPRTGSDDFLERLTPQGRFSAFRVPGRGPSPDAVTRGPGGDIWFTERRAIGRITPAGRFSKFPTSGPGGNSDPDGITVGEDGNVWFSDYSADSIDRMTPAGKVSAFKIPTHEGAPFDIVSGPAHDNLWFTQSAAGRIGRLHFSYLAQ